MELVNISKICNIEIGKTPSRSEITYWGTGVNWVSIRDMKEKYIFDTKEEITLKAIKETGIKLVPKNTVIMSFKLSVGKVAIVGKDMYTNEAIAAFHILDENKIYNKYLYYALQTLRLTDNTDRATMGLTLNKQKLKQISIPVPPLETQKKIVEVLDKAQGLIDARKEQIKLMDELIQSVFYEMFGDPVTNPKGWENQRLVSICTKIGSGATPRGGKLTYKTEGISLIRSMNVHNGAFKYDDLAYIDNAQAKKLSNVVVEKSDVLLNITGASVARSCLVPKKILPARVNQHVSIIRTNEEKANGRYINNLFINQNFQKVLMKIATSGGATREAITKEQLNELYIPIPNIKLQNEFDIFVQKTEVNKQLLSEALFDLESNYYSLMQKAFKGELFGGSK